MGARDGIFSASRLRLRKRQGSALLGNQNSLRDDGWLHTSHISSLEHIQQASQAETFQQTPPPTRMLIKSMLHMLCLSPSLKYSEP